MSALTAGTAALRAAARPTRRGRKKSKPRDEKRDGAERTLFGVPERFMRPRLILLATVAILVGFGVLMVYSASSVTALNDTGDSAYYLKRQLGFVAIGTIAAVVLAKVDYRLWVKRLMLPIWVFTVLLLILVTVVAATVVSFTGVIGFVGLVAPHVARIIVGSDNKYLIPAAGMFGALLMLLADMASRMLTDSVLPVGVITACIGGPVFILLILRSSKEAWR